MLDKKVLFKTKDKVKEQAKPVQEKALAPETKKAGEIPPNLKNEMLKILRMPKGRKYMKAIRNLNTLKWFQGLVVEEIKLEKGIPSEADYQVTSEDIRNLRIKMKQKAAAGDGHAQEVLAAIEDAAGLVYDATKKNTGESASETNATSSIEDIPLTATESFYETIDDSFWSGDFETFKANMEEVLEEERRKEEAALSKVAEKAGDKVDFAKLDAIKDLMKYDGFYIKCDWKMCKNCLFNEKVWHSGSVHIGFGNGRSSKEKTATSLIGKAYPVPTMVDLYSGYIVHRNIMGDTLQIIEI